MAMVAVITAIAIWLVPVYEKQAPSLPPLPFVPDTTAVPPLSSATDTSEPLSLPPPAGGIATATNGGDRARAFIYELRADGAQPDADRVFAEAERMQGEGNMEDAYLLYRFAARHGQVQAALILGTRADPAFYTEVTSYLPEADPGQAYRWYSVAVAAGNDEAALSLQALRMRVQQDAEAGDEQARRLLLQWR
jgi:TPR repeat protein